MKEVKRIQPLLPRAERSRRAAEFLRRIQQELLPDRADDYVAINMETGEYVLGKSNGEATRAFWSRWPEIFMHVCRVDGGPAVKFHGM